MSVPLLVTYGTLMRPFDRHGVLGISNALSFVSRCQFDGVLFDLGSYPGAVPGEATVHGELFRIRDGEVLPILDQYEGYDPNREEASLFVRRRVHLSAPADTTAWVYWYNGDVAGYDLISSGDWLKYRRRTSDSV